MGRTLIKYNRISQNTVNKGTSSNSVVYGNFPKYVYAKSIIEKINKFLCFVLLILVLLSLVGYYFVSDEEKRMNTLGKEIVALSNENIELQNKLDNLHSFNKVDEFIKSNTSLNTAKKIIEIPAVYKTQEPKVEPAPVNYKWTIGY